MGQYWFVLFRLLSSSVVVCNAAANGRAGRRARGRSGGRQCTAGQYGYVSLKLIVAVIVTVLRSHCLPAAAQKYAPERMYTNDFRILMILIDFDRFVGN